MKESYSAFLTFLHDKQGIDFIAFLWALPTPGLWNRVGKSWQ